MEFALAGPGLRYETGDNVLVYPQNSQEDVEAFAVRRKRILYVCGSKIGRRNFKQTRF